MLLKYPKIAPKEFQKYIYVLNLVNIFISLILGLIFKLPILISEILSIIFILTKTNFKDTLKNKRVS